MSSPAARRTAPQDFDFGMTELDEQLAGPEGANIRLQAGARLSARADAVRQLMKDGTARAEFQRTRCVYAGLLAACDVLMSNRKA